VRLTPLSVLLLMSVVAAGCTCRTASAPDASAPRLRRVDVHEHISTGAFPHALALMDAWGIDEAVQLSGGWPGHGLEANLAEARARPGRFVVFANPPLSLAQEGPIGVQAIVDALPGVKQQGAKGLKIFKSLGLSVVGPDGALLAVDDPLLDPVFEKAGELGLPIAIHTGDPVAFWQPVGPQNERIDELTVHPRWSYAGKPVPSWEALFEQYERRVARHPKTIFIGVHFGNAPEDPVRVGAMLDKYPNLYVDTAARVPELGRGNIEAVRDIFVKHADRILFGTDLGVGVGSSDLMLGSTGATPPGPQDVARFFTSTWRFFETRDSPIPTPTPIQGRWDISGLGLPREVLEKIYSGNADRLLGLR
jgi:predicted TIM-barrel fold metal-dependent hydrolase